MINTSNIINLNSYIRISSIKEKFEENCLFINDIDEINDINVYNCENIIFETSQLKNLFFESLKLKDVPHTVINCLSSTELFDNAVFNSHGITIFDNVCSCRNNEILDEVIKYKNKKIMVC